MNIQNETPKNRVSNRIGFRPGMAHSLYSKTEAVGDCLEWTGTKNDKGYGYIKNGGQRYKAHRVAWILHYGELDESMLIDHVCHNRACVRLAHLRPVTNKQNSENRSVVRAKSGIMGVYQGANGRWYGRVVHYGKTYPVGGHATAEDATVAVQRKRAELHTHYTI